MRSLAHESIDFDRVIRVRFQRTRQLEAVLEAPPVVVVDGVESGLAVAADAHFAVQLLIKFNL